MLPKMYLVLNLLFIITKIDKFDFNFNLLNKWLSSNYLIKITKKNNKKLHLIENATNNISNL